MWAEASDVIDAWIGAGAPSDEDQVEIWIGKAERMIRRTVPDLQDRLDAEAEEEGAPTDLLDTVRDVLVAMVTRVFRNPEGVRQRSGQEGPYGASVTYGGDIPGGLSIADDELDALRGASPVTGGAFTVQTIPVTSPFYPGS